MDLCGAETWTVRKVDQKYLGSFEMWCWRRTGDSSWTDHVTNAELGYYIESMKKGTFSYKTKEG